MLRLIHLIAFLAPVAFATEAPRPRGRLAAIIAEADRRADCVVRLMPKHQPDSSVATDPPIKIGAGPLALRVIRPGDTDLVTRALNIHADPRVAAVSGDHVDAALLARGFALGQISFDEMGWSGLLNFAVTERASAGFESVIGVVRVSRPDLEVPRDLGLVAGREEWFELTVHLHPDIRGRGYGTDVAGALASFLMLERNAAGIYARVDGADGRAQRALARAGFKEIKRAEHASVYGLVSIVHFALLHSDFEMARVVTEASVPRVPPGAISGGVPAGIIITIDSSVAAGKAVKPRPGNNFARLTIAPGDPHRGRYASVPDANPLGGPVYVSALDLEYFIWDATAGGRLDHERFARRLTEQVHAPDLRQLFAYLAGVLPNDFVARTVFKRRRALETFASEVAEIRGTFRPFSLVLLDGDGRDLFTREDVLRRMNTDD